MKRSQPQRRNDPGRAALVREMRSTGYPEKSIYRWINANRGPRDPHGARAWQKALVAAKAKLAKATS